MDLQRFLNMPSCVFAEGLGDLQRLRQRYTVNGNPTIVGSARGRAISLDGTAWVTCQEDQGEVSGPMSWSFWMKTISSSTLNIVSKWDGTPNQRCYVIAYYGSSDGEMFLLKSSTGANAEAEYANRDMGDGR